MAKSLTEYLEEHPVDQSAVDRRKRQLVAQVQAYRLKELRERAHLTQRQLAGRLHVSQNRISNIELGDLERIQLDTLRKYVEAMGGALRVEVILEGASIPLELPPALAPQH